MSSSQQQKPKKRVLVVGAGAAGMACASQLSQSPDFDVTLVDAVVRSSPPPPSRRLLRPPLSDLAPRG